MSTSNKDYDDDDDDDIVNNGLIQYSIQRAIINGRFTITTFCTRWHKIVADNVILTTLSFRCWCLTRWHLQSNMALIEVYFPPMSFKNFHFFPFKSCHTVSRHLSSTSTTRWISLLSLNCMKSSRMCMSMLVIYAKFIDYTVNICVIFYNLFIIKQWTFN